VKFMQKDWIRELGERTNEGKEKTKLASKQFSGTSGWVIVLD
jgi:hypothetical protein